MQLTLTEEQRMIRASALDWLAGNYDHRQREASLHRDGGSPAAWTAFAELGWLGLPLPATVGGLEAAFLESCLLMQAMGRHLVVEPWHACVQQAARLLALAGTPEQQQAWLPGVVSGTHRLALADGEGGKSLPLAPLKTLARRLENGWEIVGSKRAVISAPGTIRWIVSAHTQDDAQTCLFLVDPRSDGVAMDGYDTADGKRAADLVFHDVFVADSCRMPGSPHAGAAASCLALARAEATVAECWFAAGAMRAAFEQTAAYVQQRWQFGKPLSSLQVVQHRIAEMAVQCAEAEAACELACLRLAQDTDTGLELAAMAKSKVARAARFVAQESVQLHGAMGVCEELAIAAAFRALTAFRYSGGDSATHAAAYGRHLLSSGAFALSQTLHA